MYHVMCHHSIHVPSRSEYLAWIFFPIVTALQLYTFNFVAWACTGDGLIPCILSAFSSHWVSVWVLWSLGRTRCWRATSYSSKFNCSLCSAGLHSAEPWTTLHVAKVLVSRICCVHSRSDTSCRFGTSFLLPLQRRGGWMTQKVIHACCVIVSGQCACDDTIVECVIDWCAQTAPTTSWN
jgi:hypothetical protein